MTPTQDGLSAIVPVLPTLSRMDKLRLIQLLAADLAQDEGDPLLQVGVAYPVWTPLDADDASAVLLRELEKAAS
jgi:hypothetical protein